MTRNIPLVILFVVGLAIRSLTAQDSQIAVGKSEIEMKVNSMILNLYCYKPTNYQKERLLVVMHGVKRNADEYRDHAIGMGDRFKALVIAPKFDSQRFPSIKYNRGGIVTEDKQLVPESEWTYSMLPEMVRQIRQREATPDLPFWIIGHSAGGQFIARMAAFKDIGAQRMIAANPGSHLFPTRQMPFGYGLGELPESLATDQRIRDYLSAPLTIYLGTGDDHPDEYFDDSPEAMAQGAGRYQRGKACFEAARKLAAENNWPLNWRIIEAEGVIHDHQAMFDHPQCEIALFGSKD